MKVAIAADHAGYDLKQNLIAYLNKQHHEVIDLGTDTADLPSDYPDAAEKVAEVLLKGQADRGILIAGNAVGPCMAANKIRGIYAGTCHDVYSAHEGVEHGNINVICLGARVIGGELAREVVRAFLGTNFTGEERHQLRFAKVQALEQSNTTRENSSL